VPNAADTLKRVQAVATRLLLVRSLWYWFAMPQHLTVEIIPDPEEGGFTARIPDIPAYGEGETEEEAIADLKEAIQAYIEAFGLEDVLARLNPPSALRQLDWDLQTLARPRA